MHEVELRGRKIVIVRDKGKFSAVNGLCAHYNWPLINGENNFFVIIPAQYTGNVLSHAYKLMFVPVLVRGKT